MKILSGQKIREEIILELKSEVSALKTKSGQKLCLAIIQVGSDEASSLYVNNKIKFGERIGISCELINFPHDIEQKVINEKILSLNEDENITGIIIQLPLPKKLNKEKAINLINYKKDVDGLGAINLAKLINKDKEGIVPATARGIIQLLEKNDINISGKNVLMIGRSTLVGKTTALALISKDATVTIAHSLTRNLRELVQENHIIISAVGKPSLIDDSYVLEGKVLIDVGISVKDGKIVGDLNLSDIKKDGLLAVSPVPGGVGPMTVLSLFQNVIQAHNLQK